MVALFAARNAGIGVPEPAIQKALRFFAECQTPDGGIGYTAPGGPDGARTAIGAFVFALAKQQKSAAFRLAIDYLHANPVRRRDLPPILSLLCGAGFLPRLAAGLRSL